MDFTDLQVVNKYGADALRLYLINSPVVKAENLRFKEDGVRDIIKDVFLPWYNAYRFFMQNLERLQRVRPPPPPSPPPPPPPALTLCDFANTGGGRGLRRRRRRQRPGPGRQRHGPLDRFLHAGESPTEVDVEDSRLI